MRAPNLLAMMAALYGLGLANIFIRSSMGVLAPELAVDLALSPEMLGAIASAFFLSYALMQIPTGLMLDRFGPRLTVNSLFLLTVIGTLLFALSPSGPIMLIARILMGVGCAGVFAGAFLVIARFYPPARFTPIGATLNSFAMLGHDSARLSRYDNWVARKFCMYWQFHGPGCTACRGGGARPAAGCGC